MGYQEPFELELIAREEQEARLRVEEARQRQRRSEGEAPTEDEALLHRLEAEWKHALERLHRARESAED